jgi:hypothetical protein
MPRTLADGRIREHANEREGVIVRRKPCRGAATLAFAPSARTVGARPASGRETTLGIPVGVS